MSGDYSLNHFTTQTWMTRLGDNFRKGKWVHLKINSTKLQNRFPFNLTVSLRFVFHGEEKILNIQDPNEMRVDV